MFGEQQSTWIRPLQMAEQAKKNPHDDDLESVLKRAISEQFLFLKILILSFIQAEHLAKSAANYSNNEVIQKVVEKEKMRRDTETDQISGNKISKYGRGKGEDYV